MNGRHVFLKSTLQPITTLSTIEDKYIEIIEAIKEAFWQLKRLIMEMGVKQSAVVLHSDS